MLFLYYLLISGAQNTGNNQSYHMLFDDALKSSIKEEARDVSEIEHLITKEAWHVTS